MSESDHKLPLDGGHMEMGQRIAAWLRQAYPSNGAKRAAQDFDASPHTTRKWFAGLPPSNEHFAAMARKWGRRFVQFATEPLVGPWPEFDIEGEMAALRARFDSLQEVMRNETLGRAAVDHPSPQGRRVAHGPCRVVGKAED